MKNKLLTVIVFAGAASLAIMSACAEKKPRSIIDVQHIGLPKPVSFSATPGECDSKWITGQDEKLSSTICRGPQGRIRITVRCADPKLPEAFIEMEYAEGTSNSSVFFDVCSSTSEQILAGNKGQIQAGHWYPDGNAQKYWQTTNSK